MKKVDSQEREDDVRPEYDFSSMTGGIRGKYYERYRAGVNLVLLEPEIARAFPTDEAVNAALRSVMRAVKPAKRRTRRAVTAKSRRTTSAADTRRRPRR